jgi:hypothetical protein
MTMGVLLVAGCGAREPVRVGECEPGQGKLSNIGFASSSATVPADLVDRGACDAARRASTPVERVEIVSANTQTWPDASLGCPVPGQVYGAVLTEGYQLVLRASERTYDYRAAKRTDGRQMTINLCES